MDLILRKSVVSEAVAYKKDQVSDLIDLLHLVHIQKSLLYVHSYLLQ